MTFGMVTRVAQLFWAGVGLINYGLLIVRRAARQSGAPAGVCEVSEPIRD
jgi:hypothetical protein